jgi:hypothetical protein
VLAVAVVTSEWRYASLRRQVAQIEATGAAAIVRYGFNWVPDWMRNRLLARYVRAWGWISEVRCDLRTDDRTILTDPGLLSGIRVLHVFGAADADLADVTNHPDIEYLHLPESAISDDGIRALAHHPGLRGIDFDADTPTATGVGFAGDGVFVGLATIAGGWNTLTDDGVRAIAALPNLHFISLIQAQRVGDDGFLSLRRCQSLRELWIPYEGQISADAVAQFRKDRPDVKISKSD